MTETLYVCAHYFLTLQIRKLVLGEWGYIMCQNNSTKSPPTPPPPTHTPPPHSDHLRAKCIVMWAKLKYVDYYCKKHMEPS